MSDSDQKSDAAFLAPCIVAAWVWLAIVLYALIVIPNIFNLEAFQNKPEQLRLSAPSLERWVMHFQIIRGTFACALLGGLGCFFSYARKSALLANVMILLGIAILLGLVWATMATLPK